MLKKLFKNKKAKKCKYSKEELEAMRRVEVVKIADKLGVDCTSPALYSENVEGAPKSVIISKILDK